MKLTHRLPRLASTLGVALSLSLLGSMAVAADLKLSGDTEVPPVKTTASGISTIAIAADGAVAGSVKTTGVTGTAAHIHVGAAGKNGQVIIPLTMGANGEWSVPPGAKLTDEQMKTFKSGDLYVNVHSEANKGGEIRAQLKP
jgi:CHRD domain